MEHSTNLHCGQLFATCLTDVHAAVWHTATGMLVRVLQDSIPGDVTARSAAWSPDGTLLATSSRDGSTTVWEVATFEDKLTLKPRTFSARSEVTSVAWSPNGLQTCTASGDGITRLWDVGTGDLVYELAWRATQSDFVGRGQLVAWSPDSTFVASAPGDGTVKVWDAATGAATRVLGGHASPVSSVAWSPGGSMLVSGTAKDTAQVWDAATGTVMHTVEGGRITVGAVAWSTDERLLAIATKKVL